MQYSFIVLGLGHWSLVRRPNNVVARTLEGSFYALSHWLRAMWWSAARNNKYIYKKRRRAVRARGWVGSTPVPISHQVVLPARKREQPTAPKIRAANFLGELSLVGLRENEGLRSNV